MVAASKHAFSFGAAGFATLAFLAIENSDTCNENAATDNQPSPYATNALIPEFHPPVSVCEMDTDASPLNPDRPWSPLAEGGNAALDRQRLWTHWSNRMDAYFGDQNHAEGPSSMERHWPFILLKSTSF
jgi:hypothetical protein